MQDDFTSLEEFITEMNSSNSTNHKVEVLGRFSSNPFVVRVLQYTYYPYKQFNMTSATLRKWERPSEDCEYLDLFSLLDALDAREITGHDALSKTRAYLDRNSQHASVFYQILDRNLETRATTTLINRVIPGLIPTFNVALAHDASKVKGVDLIDGTWFVSRKLDGVRCIAIVREPGDVRFYSRNGKEFETLGRVKDEILRLGLSHCVLDGEICLENEEGSDDFQGILKQIQRKDHTVLNPKYWVFDYLAPEEFENGTSLLIFSERQARIETRLNGSRILVQLSQERIDSESALVDLKESARSMDWEGLIARRDVPYEGDRTRNMLKLKEFHDAEYEVKNVVMGPQRVIVDGHEIEEEMLSALIVEHRGCQVRVGSGFTIEERRLYYREPERILGQQVTVQYFEETVDQDGNHSLRFPVFKWNHGKYRSI
jgi:DNA ligase-1